MPHLPTQTLRDLAVVAVLIADVAWDGAKDALARLRPYVEPPSDLSVRSAVGGLYTGILLVDRNEVLAGLVIRAGHEPPPESESTHRFARPSSRSSPMWGSSSLTRRLDETEDENEETRLPGWGEDTRDGSERWRR